MIVEEDEKKEGISSDHYKMPFLIVVVEWSRTDWNESKSPLEWFCSILSISFRWRFSHSQSHPSVLCILFNKFFLFLDILESQIMLVRRIDSIHEGTLKNKDLCGRVHPLSMPLERVSSNNKSHFQKYSKQCPCSRPLFRTELYWPLK